MGAAQSVIASPTAVAVAVIAGAAAYSYTQTAQPARSERSPTPAPASSSASSKKKKQKKQPASARDTSTAEPTVVAFPPVVPGGFDAAPAPDARTPEKEQVSKPKKKKAKKAAPQASLDAQSDSSATAPESSVTPARKPSKKSAGKREAPSALDDNGQWTRVEARRKTSTQPVSSKADGGTREQGLEVSTSDAGITTSVTGNSSPVTERTEDESAQSLLQESARAPENRRLLAERLLPKPRKTGVDDMLEQSDYPKIARVMRVRPNADEQPASGFSWADYEDVDHSRLTANDADGEDDGGWGVVKSKTRTRTAKPPSQDVASGQESTPSLTKKQRQNAARREAQKAAKAETEAERLASLAKHKREVERAKIAEQYGKGKSKEPSGGMSAYVDENGKLVWK